MPESIMIVEDEGVVAFELQQYLMQLGYAVPAVVASGEEALAKAIECKPDLILMDIRLKGEVDGIEAARRIAEAGDIPIVYLTAYSDDVTVERARKTAPFGYVLKPWEEKSLELAIEMTLHKASLEAEIRQQRDWYFSVLRYMGTPMIVCGADGKVRFVNVSAEQLLAIQPSGDSLRPLDEIVRVQPGASSAVSVLQDALRDRGSGGRPLLLTGRDGIELPVEVTAAAIRSGKNALLGYVLFLEPKTAVARSLSQDEKASANLLEYLKMELVRLLILQEHGGEGNDRFVEGQLDAHRKLMQRLFGPAAVAGESDWRRGIIRRAVRDAHEQTRKILSARADVARSGGVPQATLERYLEVMVGRIVDSHGLTSEEVRVAIAVDPGTIDLDRAIYAVLIVNEVVVQALSTGARGLIQVRLGSNSPELMSLAIRHQAPDPSHPDASTPVLDALIAEVHGSLATHGGPERTWEVTCPL